MAFLFSTTLKSRMNKLSSLLNQFFQRNIRETSPFNQIIIRNTAVTYIDFLFFCIVTYTIGNICHKSTCFYALFIHDQSNVAVIKQKFRIIYPLHTVISYTINCFTEIFLKIYDCTHFPGLCIVSCKFILSILRIMIKHPQKHIIF